MENHTPKTIAKQKYMKTYDKNEFATVILELKELQIQIDKLEQEIQNLVVHKFPQKQLNANTGQKEYLVQQWEDIIAIVEKKDEHDAANDKLKELKKRRDFLKDRAFEQLPQSVHGRPIQIKGVLLETAKQYDEIVTIMNKTEIHIGTPKC